MFQSRAGLILAVVGCLGLWGCSQEHAGSPRSTDASEKTGKLHDEIKSLTSQRDTLREDLKHAQTDGEKLVAELADLRKVVKQRDELAKTLATRTAERDAAVEHLGHIKKNVKALLDVVESPASTLTPAESE